VCFTGAVYVSVMLCVLLCSLTATLQEDVKQIVHLLTAQPVLLGEEDIYFEQFTVLMIV
jgi:hypothetical protein